MNEFQRYLAEEFVEDYAEGRLTRRQALKLIASVTGSLLLANSLLAACAAPPEASSTPAATGAPAQPTSGAPATSQPPAPTAVPATPAGVTAATTEVPATSAAATAPPLGTVSPDDPAVQAGPVEFAGQGATLRGYRARPAQEGQFPVVLVCHENRGLNAYVEDVTRRLAKAGFVGLAVDLLSRQGGSQAVSADDVPGLLAGMPPDQFVQDFVSGWQSLQAETFALTAQVGMVGFCFGGGVTWRVATHMPELKAAVPFYGPPPPVEDLANVQAAVLAIYGGRDQRITQTAPAIEAAMQQNGKVFEKVIYPDADHAFHNDTGSRYNAQAAQDAWARTLAWFAKYLAA